MAKILGIREELESQVATPLGTCAGWKPLSFTDESGAILQESILSSSAAVHQLIQQVPRHINTPGYMEPLEEKALRVQRYENAALFVYEKIKRSMNILRYPPSVDSNSVDAQFETTTKLQAFHLNDLFVTFLLLSENHNLASENWLGNLLNNRGGHLFIFNYLLRRFRIRSTVAEVYLNFDLRLSLEESPFTQELRGLLKCSLITSMFYISARH
jgi:hypothetical protein